MGRQGRPRRRPEAPSAPTTLTEITRRYYATAMALSKAMGLPLTETFLREHRESISCCFIKAGRAGGRLPPAVQLPPLSAPPGTAPPGAPEAGELIDTMTPDPEQEPSTTNGHAPPVAIPKDAGLPCAGVAIALLKPAQLAMLISKTARLVHDEGEAWVPLLGALQVERGRRLEAGRQGTRPSAENV